MASFNIPNVSGMSSVEELKDAVGKMTKELSFLLQHLDWKNINELNIQLNGGASVTISDDGIVINDGETDTFHADVDGKVSMTGATIQSKSEYPKYIIDPKNNLFGAYFSADYYVSIEPDIGGAPLITLVSPWNTTTISSNSSGAAIQTDNDLIIASSVGDINLSQGMEGTGKLINIRDFTSLYSVFEGTSLGTALAGKATLGVTTDPSGSANGGIPIGTQLMVNGGGYVTWSGIPSHSHKQN